MISDQQFEEQFQDLSLDPQLFNHEGHLRLAWIHLNKYGLEQAIQNLCDQIRKFATHHGAPDKYHCTLTVAAVKTMHHFMQKTDSSSFEDLIETFPRIKYNFKDLIDAHYGFNILASAEAKKEFIEPDLIPYT